MHFPTKFFLTLWYLAEMVLGYTLTMFAAMIGLISVPFTALSFAGNIIGYLCRIMTAEGGTHFRNAQDTLSAIYPAERT